MRNRDRDNMTSRGGGGAWGTPADRMRETNSNIMEMGNNQHINQLGDQVSMLKSLTIDINQEVESQNRLLDGLDDSMFNASGLLGSTVRKINVMMAQGGSKHMCYLVGFIVFTFMVIWYIMKHKSG